MTPSNTYDYLWSLPRSDTKGGCLFLKKSQLSEHGVSLPCAKTFNRKQASKDNRSLLSCSFPNWSSPLLNLCVPFAKLFRGYGLAALPGLSCQRGNLGCDHACWGQSRDFPLHISAQQQCGDPSATWSAAPYVISRGRLREDLCDEIRQPRLRYSTWTWDSQGELQCRFKCTGLNKKFYVFCRVTHICCSQDLSLPSWGMWPFSTRLCEGWDMLCASYVLCALLVQDCSTAPGIWWIYWHV